LKKNALPKKKDLLHFHAAYFYKTTKENYMPQRKKSFLLMYLFDMNCADSMCTNILHECASNGYHCEYQEKVPC
jgi:hypothetical protein